MANLALAAGAEIVSNRWRAAVIALLELSIAPFGYVGGVGISRIIVARAGYKWIYYFSILQSGIGLLLIIRKCCCAVHITNVAPDIGVQSFTGLRRILWLMARQRCKNCETSIGLA